MERKIVLIILPSPWLISDTDMPNLGILYIAASLRASKCNVQVVDLCGVPEERWQIPEGDIYGISLTTPQFHLARKVAALLRQRQKNAVIVMGGSHSTALPHETLEKTEANVVVRGEGEHVFQDIINIPWYNGTVKEVIEAGLVEDIDKLPIPARDMIDIFSYHEMGTNAVAGVGPRLEEYVITSRGCPFRCSYCAQMVMSNFLVRYRSLDSIVTEMVWLMKRYGVGRFYLFDDIFVIDKKRVRAFNDRMRQLRSAGHVFDWHCLSRSDIVVKAGKDLLEDMKDAGCVQITYGIEHGSDRMLVFNEKDATAADNRQAIEWTVDAGIRVRAQMIVGLPGETRETVEETAEFMRTSPAHSWGVHIFVPLPGSPVWDDPHRFNFEFSADATYQHYQTIGKPGEWSAQNIHANAEEIREWAEYLRSVAGERNVHAFDARLKS